jgi:hypothetical protein
MRKSIVRGTQVEKKGAEDSCLLINTQEIKFFYKKTGGLVYE